MTGTESKGSAVNWGNLGGLHGGVFLTSFVLEMRVPLSSGCIEGTSHLRVYDLFKGRRVRAKVRVTFLLPPSSHTLSA